MAYSELIKNFDNIRGYMRDFFLYGFKTREEYDRKSARSYDNERRRIQSYLGHLISFRQTPSGKNAFISLEGRSVTHNPLYQAFKAKSFTNKDITLHFLLLDILSDAGVDFRKVSGADSYGDVPQAYSLKEILRIMDTEYLTAFQNPISFDESTLRKKLKEYEELGIVVSEKSGRTVTYRLSENEICLAEYKEAIRFFTEESPLGVIGSYLEDRMQADAEKAYPTGRNDENGKCLPGRNDENGKCLSGRNDENGKCLSDRNDENGKCLSGRNDCAGEYLTFKNHYIMNAYDAEITELILQGIHEKRLLEITSFSRGDAGVKQQTVIPYKLYVSTQGGRNYLFCMDADNLRPYSLRVDYIQKGKAGEVCADYDRLLKVCERAGEHMWGVSCAKYRRYEHIEMDIYVGTDEAFIVRRLEREKRCGTVSKVDEETYRFSADVLDAYEMMPWIRTFFGRIKAIRCDNEDVKNQIKIDMVKMLKQYEDEHAFS